jgi:carboxyl-terminal processing protease
MKTLKNKIILFVIAFVVLISFSAYKPDFFEIAKQIEIFTSLFKTINMNYVDETNPAELMTNSAKEMLEQLDPYTVFMNAQDIEDARLFQSRDYVGIGARLFYENDALIVSEIYNNLSADKSGLKIGDRITMIDNIPVKDLKENSQKLIGGKKNSIVNIGVRRKNELLTFSLVRGNTPPRAVPSSKLLENGIGYIALDRFSETAASEVEIAVKTHIINEAKGLILDLRNNPGGLLSEAVKVVNLFVPKDQLVVYTTSNIEAHNTTFTTQKQPVSLDIPLAIIINEKSASASEIVAGALQDLDRAVVIGEKSFGKGLVQRPMTLPYETQLKITISRYHTPSGRCIQALDYKNRTNNGTARKIETFKSFTTKNGREVLDGGGIRPDIQTSNRGNNRFINNLINGKAVFKFTNAFCLENDEPTFDNFKVDDKTYKQFKTYVLNDEAVILSDTEEELEQLKASIIDDGLENILETTVTDIRDKIKTERIALLDTYSKELRFELSCEIIKRYFYRQGLYEYLVLFDTTLSEAVKTLLDPSSYNKLLN